MHYWKQQHWYHITGLCKMEGEGCITSLNPLNLIPSTQFSILVTTQAVTFFPGITCKYLNTGTETCHFYLDNKKFPNYKVDPSYYSCKKN